MNDKSKQIIRSLLLTAAASFLHHGASAVENREMDITDFIKHFADQFEDVGYY